MKKGRRMDTTESFNLDGQDYKYYALEKIEGVDTGELNKLPKSIKVLLENLLRHEDGNKVTGDDIKTLAQWGKDKKGGREIAYHPSRVLMQDFTGVPAVVDLAAMRDAIKDLGGDPTLINPLTPVDLVIDHSVSVEKFGNSEAFKENVDIEYARNQERYSFLRWGQKAFENFRVVPPGTGICHQVNLEYLAQVVWSKKTDSGYEVYPDTLVGTDSHTTMINGLSVLGWGVGGIEAEAAMLGQPVSMLIPEVIGFKLEGNLPEGATATDLVLKVVQMLREKGVVGKFVEFYGKGIKNLSLADRATLSNMAPEYGATMGFFPIDEETLNYLRLTGREENQINIIETYAKKQGLWCDGDEDLVFTDSLQLDLGTVRPSISGPKRPQDNIYLTDAKETFNKALQETFQVKDEKAEVAVEGEDFTISHGHVSIAAITSCTNTSNPSVMLAAGLVAKKANAKGLKVKPWVKTSLAPGSQVVSDYLEKAGLQKELDELGFNLVGYGCTTCIGNSGPLPENISKAINDGDLVATSVLSGNRNFEGRISPDVKANFLASPPLVVAYALAGSLKADITTEAIGKDKDGNDVFLKDIWPSQQEINEAVSMLTSDMFKKRYDDVFLGDKSWQAVKTSESMTFNWDKSSTYITNPPFFSGMSKEASDISDIVDAKPLAILGDSVTTDHISPAGVIATDGPAAKYLNDHKVERKDFNSYGSRRGNFEVMMRGTFANIRIRNKMAQGKEGGYTFCHVSNKIESMYDAAEKYQDKNIPLVIFAGKEYGTGSSRDWAAKGTRLQGIKAVIAESFERIHRSNLVGMGVLPLQFTGSDSVDSLNLDGTEEVTIKDLKGNLKPQATIPCEIKRKDGSVSTVNLLTRIDTDNEFEYYKNTGILHYVLRNLAKK